MSRTPIVVAGIVTASLVALAAFLFFGREPSLHGSVIEPRLSAPAISLTDQTGKVLELRELQGNVVLLFFGYTNCPDVCPLTMANLKRALDLMGGDAVKTRVVMVTTDPSRDTPTQLGAFVGRFDPDFIGMTGSEEDLAVVWAAYGVAVMDGGETHSSYVYVIDPAGTLAETLGADVDAAVIAADVRTLLRDR